MARLRPVLIVVAIIAVLFVGMAIQSARDRAHQLPLGNHTSRAQGR